MSQRKSTSFSAAKVANFGVVMAEMVLEMSELRKEVKRLRHHVSVLSKRNDRLVKDGKRGAASSIASDASLSSDDEEVGEEEGSRVRVVRTVIGEEARRKAHGDGVRAPWCEEEAESFWREAEEKRRFGGRTKWKVAELDVASSVVASSVAVEEEEEVSVPVVKIPSYEKGGEKRRRVGECTEEEEEAQAVKELVAPVGPRIRYGGLMRRVEEVGRVVKADPRCAAGGNSGHALTGVSRGTDAWRQSPGGSGGYQLRPRIGGSTFRGYGGRGRGRGVFFWVIPCGIGYSTVFCLWFIQWGCTR